MQEQEQLRETEQDGVTLREIFRTVWLRKWVAIAVAAGIFLVGVLSLYFGYNRAVNDYVIEFGLNLPGEAEGAGYVYPDGTQFHYTDITSISTLQAVRDSDEEFKGIDIETMVKDGHIHIGREVAAATNVGASGYSETTYKITARAKYFGDVAQARKFLTELAGAPADYLSKMNIDYGVYLPMAKAADDYESEINFLKNQLEVIQKGYDNLIKTYGGNFVGNSEGKTLLAFSQEVKAYSDRGVLTSLLVEARDETTEEGQRKPIIKSLDNKDKYRLELAALNTELANATKTLETLLKGTGGSASVAVYTSRAATNDTDDENQGGVTIKSDAEVLKEQQDLVNELTNKKVVLERYINAGVIDASFDAKTEAAYNTIANFTETYKTTCATVYAKAASVTYVQPGIVTTSGGLSLIMIVLICLVIGIIIALIAAYIAGRYKLKALKEDSAEESAETVTVAGNKPDGE